mmetsp:Transcript_37835/g.92983  ORF Transcript_37835/g.92983 Transcript_37835/m.92983 type:complete len:173 (+) Transcript_37835:1-519(+)
MAVRSIGPRGLQAALLASRLALAPAFRQPPSHLLSGIRFLTAGTCDTSEQEKAEQEETRLRPHTGEYREECNISRKGHKYPTSFWTCCGQDVYHADGGCLKGHKGLMHPGKVLIHGCGTRRCGGAHTLRGPPGKWSCCGKDLRAEGCTAVEGSQEANSRMGWAPERPPLGPY